MVSCLIHISEIARVVMEETKTTTVYCSRLVYITDALTIGFT